MRLERLPCASWLIVKRVLSMARRWQKGGYVKFRIGQIVYLSLAPDGSGMGCGFPKEFRQAAVDGEPGKFSLPSESDMRFNWIHVTLAAIDAAEMRDLVEEAWSRAVPKYVAEEYASSRGYV